MKIELNANEAEGIIAERMKSLFPNLIATKINLSYSGASVELMTQEEKSENERRSAEYREQLEDKKKSEHEVSVGTP